MIAVFKWPAVLMLCSAAAHGGTLDLSFRDDNNHPLKDVIAVLLPATPENSPEAKNPGHDPATVDQRERQFAPHVSAIRTNTLVKFPNSDNIRHHVYSFSPAKRFELRLYHGTTAEPVLFDRPGKVVLGCNIHDSMLAYIYVVDSEYFGVADKQGEIGLSDVPPGQYQLEIHHPRYPETITRDVTVTADSRLRQRFTLGPLEPDPRDAAPKSELEAMFKH